MNKEHREELIKAMNKELKRIRTKGEAAETLKKVGILAPNGDLNPNYYPYPNGCLQVWNEKELKR